VIAALRMMAATRKEAGCISYSFFGDLTESGLFRIFEEWESQQALDAHFVSPHMATSQTFRPPSTRSTTRRRNSGG
jgi:quinol monooxygenase YgiN